MGRWKLGDGGAYYDSQDSGPDQVSPPPQATPQPSAGIPPQTSATDQMPDGTLPGPPSPSTPQHPPMQEWPGQIAIDYGQDGGFQWGSPGDQQRRIGSASQLLDWLRGLGLSAGRQRPAVEPKAPGQESGPMLAQRSIGGGAPVSAINGLAQGGMTALGKGATALGAMGRGLFGR